ncbi:unnamed protein product, partial [Effrenium voratum]
QPETALRAAIVADLDVARQGLEEHRGRLRQALDDGVKDLDGLATLSSELQAKCQFFDKIVKDLRKFCQG